jgi:bis(5'-nucleosyl)-tetraphosphatase (symmetrical)
MPTYAIGDIHGCYQSFMRLLEHIEFDAERDRLWLTGDLVNRGPESLGMLRWVVENQHLLEVVLGNHDLHMLAVAAADRAEERGEDFERGEYQSMHSGDTFDDILAAPDRDELLDWLGRQPLARARGEYALVHAALLPEWSVEDALGFSAEVQAAMQAEDSAEFLKTMYGNEPEKWTDELEGIARLRAIINAMTRLRVVGPDGAMAFDYSGELARMPENRAPWFDAPNPNWGTHTAIFGHWSAIGPCVDERADRRVICLDSGCVWGNKLSAMRLEDRATFQVDSELA